mgnify:CR=1
MRLVIDMNLSPAWVETMKTGGIEAIHWSQVGSADAPDLEIFE